MFVDLHNQLVARFNRWSSLNSIGFALDEFIQELVKPAAAAFSPALGSTLESIAIGTGFLPSDHVRWLTYGVEDGRVNTEVADELN